MNIKTYYNKCWKLLKIGKAIHHNNVGELVGKDKTVLDIGCGEGFIMDYLQKNNEVYGADISDILIEKTKQKRSKLTICDIENDEFPFPEIKFDVVVMTAVLEHLFDPLTTLKKIKQNCNVVVIVVPNASWISKRLAYLIGRAIKEPINDIEKHFNQQDANEPFAHLQMFNKARLTEILNFAGFTKITFNNIGKLPFFNRRFKTNSSLFSQLLIVKAEEEWKK